MRYTPSASFSDWSGACAGGPAGAAPRPVGGAPAAGAGVSKVVMLAGFALAVLIVASNVGQPAPLCTIFPGTFSPPKTREAGSHASTRQSTRTGGSAQR